MRDRNDYFVTLGQSYWHVTWTFLPQQAVIHKENNFQQPGVRFRSFDPARFDYFPTSISFCYLTWHSITSLSVRSITFSSFSVISHILIELYRWSSLELVIWYRPSYLNGKELTHGITCYRQERFIKRIVELLSDPRVTHEVRSVWLSYWSQVFFLLHWQYPEHTLLWYFFIASLCAFWLKRIFAVGMYIWNITISIPFSRFVTSAFFFGFCMILQCDKTLGQRIASHFSTKAAM
jgi:hypothetical protein